jgi:hypothetical protein
MRKPVQTGSSRRLSAEYRASDDVALNLRGALIEGSDDDVPVITLHRIFLDISIAA